MKRILVASAVLLFMLSVTLAAQGPNVVGSWDITIESPQGKNNAVLVIKKDGDKLSAAMKSPRGERPLESVTLAGNDISFVMKDNVQGQDMVFTYKGKAESSSMKGDVDFGGFASGTWSAVPLKEGAAPAAASAPASAPQGGATNISGEWSVTVETSAGSGTTTFKFKQDGDTLTGTSKGRN